MMQAFQDPSFHRYVAAPLSDPPLGDGQGNSIMDFIFFATKQLRKFASKV
jgi:hypothetical protein